ncbi:hypothetical protein SODALDRAFT_332725 [Sodiomyces alkalinus F11]|uniref:Uncharacterized protein n=1 Tax=Sodiomyces alkalinus (strain CBS 110278 / VKM F-3762 / F11) TaxID=1314773 RepID=A0A3N2PXN2_SODAK|nr:hypothetical protein SODALDRAFT_332725 [Sodiomyces alkalinus F11]ROT39289.1 hypothetical protein SODALDRAFT_332725 [Sodiomyces alkalinus F11]
MSNQHNAATSSGRNGPRPSEQHALPSGECNVNGVHPNDRSQDAQSTDPRTPIEASSRNKNSETPPRQTWEETRGHGNGPREQTGSDATSPPGGAERDQQQAPTGVQTTTSTTNGIDLSEAGNLEEAIDFELDED